MSRGELNGLTCTSQDLGDQREEPTGSPSPAGKRKPREPRARRPPREQSEAIRVRRLLPAHHARPGRAARPCSLTVGAAGGLPLGLRFRSTGVVGLPEPEFQTQVETAVTHPPADRTHEPQGRRQRTSFPGVRSGRRALEVRHGCSVVLRAHDPSTPAPRRLLKRPRDWGQARNRGRGIESGDFSNPFLLSVFGSRRHCLPWFPCFHALPRSLAHVLDQGGFLPLSWLGLR